MKPVAAIIEMAEERDRKECIALDQKVTGANQELGQWLLDHEIYTGAEVARWLECGPDRIKRLRNWGEAGFPLCGPEQWYEQNRPKRASTRDEALKTNDNLEDDTFEPLEDVEDPVKVLENILDSIKDAKAVAEAYRKILSKSPFAREEKKKIYDEITLLISKWKRVQSTLDRKGHVNG
jgi:hypothetical protein